MIIFSVDVDYFELSGVPRPKPIRDFNVREAKARPYRPFRWPYHQTMALMSLEPDYWLELESSYNERISQRRGIFVERGKTVLDAMPGSEGACRELEEMCMEYLCARYPDTFSYNRRTGSFWNGILKRDFDTRSLDPLLFLIDNVPEDFAIMIEDKKSGLYHLRAGVIVSAIGWNLGEKMGKPMHEIHGPVPLYKEKIEDSVNRYFTRLTGDKPIQRGSWSFEVGEQLFLQTDDPKWSERQHQDPSLSIEDIYLRVDWQTLRRLPKSNAIVFNYKQLRGEPYIPRLLATVLKEGPEEMLRYKGVHHTIHVVLPALEGWAKEQEKDLGVPEDWTVRTLDEHPFYPGWK
ncbi:hypothetical protein BJ912DRAFT_1022000 [Pholiota molesta]|nr:hypothetical protein BJ912DRAFT_1022000 [Pholiota molesta]